MMNILAIDTVTEFCSVSLTYQGETRQVMSDASTTHSHLVLDMVKELTRSFGIHLSELDALAVDIGPGSFTGVRIGLGVAQGLAYGSDLSVIGVGSLETLSVSKPGALVIPALDARMGQIYCSIYDTREGVTSLCEPLVCDPDGVEFGSLVHLILPVDTQDQNGINQDKGETKIYGLGNGWAEYYDPMMNSLAKEAKARNSRFIEEGVFSCVAECYPEARMVAEVAQLKGMSAAVSPMHLLASYVRNQVAKKSKPHSM